MKIKTRWFWLEFIYAEPSWGGYVTGVRFAFCPTYTKLEGFPLFKHHWGDTIFTEIPQLTP